ncbi:hypothetical protein LAJ19_01990 [Deinococcus taeanensis]|uniref:hypothetical protein n=1 Tax=Deinococcus taeanensis TaxID=2737050 RepID=UPI001CDC681F|nr:hypothetical protein [Deinococcus taeanensis]UBV43018.1 hypothetical protein LAJ19_01990 [Deinococcus taeanensis]
MHRRLDEMIRALDTTPGQLIQENLSRLMQGRTRFIVVRRLNTLRGADRSVMIEECPQPPACR